MKESATVSSALVEVFDGVAMVNIGDVSLVVWREAARLHRVRKTTEAAIALAKRYPKGSVALQFILPSSSPPDAEARQYLAEQRVEFSTRLRRLVTVPSGDGLWFSIVRSVMRGINIVSGTSAFSLVASSQEEAIDRVLEVATPHTPSREKLKEHIAAAHRALGT